MALNLASDEELRAKNKEVEKSQQAKAADEKQQVADQKRLDDLNIESLTAFIRAKALYRASRDGLSEEAERLMNKSISLDAQANKITARHNWGQFGPNPSAKLGDLQTQKTKSILGEK